MAEATAKGTVKVIELSRAQQAAARRVAESKATIPHLYLEARTRLPEGASTVGAAAILATALALKEFPNLNSAYRDGKLELYSRINIAIAIDAGETVLAPTLFDADEKTVDEIAALGESLAKRARAGELTSPELAGATFTVVDLTGTGIASLQTTINPSQSGVLSIADGDGKVRLGLSCDSRIVPWPEAAPFLARIKAFLEKAPVS